MPCLEMETSGPDHLHTGTGEVASARTGAMIGVISVRDTQPDSMVSVGNGKKLCLMLLALGIAMILFMTWAT
jgi:hypothetical protein